MIVMDASAAVEITRGTQKGRALLTLIEPDEVIVAPSWFQAEVANVFWKYVHAGLIDKETATERSMLCEALVSKFIPIDDVKREAFFEAINQDHSFYDMVYLCLARRNGATLFTLDKQLVDICSKAKVDCIDEVKI